MQNFTFYILVGSQVLKSSLANVEGFRGQLEYYFRPHPTGVGPVFRVVETKDAFYLHCWGREITALHRLDNHAPLVLYPDYDFDRDRNVIKAFLRPLELWRDGQFGVWSFAVETPATFTRMVAEASQYINIDKNTEKENEMQPKIDLPLHMGDPIWDSMLEKLQQLRTDGRKVAGYQIEPDKIQIELWFPHVTELIVKQKADAPKIFSDDSVTSPPVLTLSDETCQKIANGLAVRLCDPIISVGIRSCISNVLNRWAALPNDLKHGSSLAELANAVDELSLSLYGCSEGK